MGRKVTRVLETRVTFDLPDWFGNRKEFLVAGHEYRYDNKAHQALFRLSGVVELCHDPMAKCVVVRFRCAPAHLSRRIRDFEAKLARFLRRYKEARA